MHTSGGINISGESWKPRVNVIDSYTGSTGGMKSRLDTHVRPRTTETLLPHRRLLSVISGTINGVRKSNEAWTGDEQIVGESHIAPFKKNK